MKKNVLLFLFQLFILFFNTLFAQDVRVFFGFNKATLTKQEQKKLENLDLSNSSYIVIIGEADGVGDELYNYNLALRRAHTVETYLHNRYPELKTFIASLGEKKAIDNIPNPNNRIVTIYAQSANGVCNIQKVLNCDSVFYDECSIICYHNGDSIIYRSQDHECDLPKVITIDTTFIVNPYKKIQIVKKQSWFEKIIDAIIFWKDLKTKDIKRVVDTSYKISLKAKLQIKYPYKKNIRLINAEWKDIIEIYSNNTTNKKQNFNTINEKQMSFFPSLIIVDIDKLYSIEKFKITIPKNIPFSNDILNLNLKHYNNKDTRQIDTIYTPIIQDDKYVFNLDKIGIFYFDFVSEFNTTGKTEIYSDNNLKVFSSNKNAKFKLWNAEDIIKNVNTNKCLFIKYGFHISSNTKLLLKTYNYWKYYKLYRKTKGVWLEDTLQGALIKNTTTINNELYYLIDINREGDFIIAKECPKNENFKEIIIKKSCLQKLNNENIRILIYDENNKNYIKPYSFYGLYLMPDKLNKDKLHLLIKVKNKIIETNLNNLKNKNNIYFIFYDLINK